MSERQWKPGDVALVRNEYGVWNVAICSVRPTGRAWRYGVADSFMPLNAEARPLLVVDPEDEAEAEAIVKAFVANGVWGVIPIEVEDSHTYRREQVQAALRSLIAPPKPPEPTGLGAVVEDVAGRVWVQINRSGLMWAPSDDRSQWKPWDDIDAVRVLSEGVQP